MRQLDDWGFEESGQRMESHPVEAPAPTPVPVTRPPSPGSRLVAAGFVAVAAIVQAAWLVVVVLLAWRLVS